MSLTEDVLEAFGVALAVQVPDAGDGAGLVDEGFQFPIGLAGHRIRVEPPEVPADLQLGPVLEQFLEPGRVAAVILPVPCDGPAVLPEAKEQFLFLFPTDHRAPHRAQRGRGDPDQDDHQQQADIRHPGLAECARTED